MGSVHQIRWLTEGVIDNISIDYSFNSGNSWVNIADAVTNTDSYDWTVPDTPSDLCLVRVRGSDSDDDPSDISDNEFALVVDDTGCVLTWSAGYTGADNFYSLVRGAGTYIAAGAGGAVYSSTNGKTRSALTSGVNEDLHGVGYGAGLFVIVGKNGMILTSSNGWAWMNRDSGITDDLYAVAYGADRFVAVGAGCAVVTSSDGFSWTIQNTGSSANLYGMVFNGSKFVAVGSGGTLLSSADGSVWTGTLPGFQQRYAV